MTYNPSNWYWAGTPVGYNSPIVYGSARVGLVSNPSTDAGWVAAQVSGAWTSWPKDATGAVTTVALDEVLTAASPPQPPTGLTALTQAQLLAYANGKVNALLAVQNRAYEIAAAGGEAQATVHEDGGLQIVGGTYFPTSTWQDLTALTVGPGALSGTATTQWIDNNGAVATLSGDQLQALASAITAYGASVWAILATAAADIAVGTITTSAEIDALSWPT